MQIKRKAMRVNSMKKLYGQPNQCGIGMGPLFILESPEESRLGKRKVEDREAEILRLEQAVQRAEQQLQRMADEAGEQINANDASIFEIHIAFLYDPGYIGAIRDRIAQKGENAEWAVQEESAALSQILAAVEGDIIRERVDDVRDVGQRLIRILQEVEETQIQIPAGEEPVVLVTEQLLPSQTIKLDTTRIAAVVTQKGGITSHAAILTKARGIPAVIGVEQVLSEACGARQMIVDAQEGLVILDPDPGTREDYQNRLEQQRNQQIRLKAYLNQPAITKNGQRVVVEANIGSAQEAKLALDSGAEGVGLFRSEFLYLDREDEPEEEEQFQAYREAVEAMGGRQVIIRTMDIGGDKPLSYLRLPREDNPFLGYRAIRVSLDREEMFLKQLRAILRSSAFGSAAVMFPMVCSLEELRRAKARLLQAQHQLEEAGHAYDKNLPVGIMVEIPAAAVISDLFAKEVDFFSIGTNDLIQYTVAADRMNQMVRGLYTPCHPAVIRLVHQVVENAHRCGKTVGICGEAASDTALIPLWTALGVDALSMSPALILQAKEVICSLEEEKLREIAARVLELKSAEEIHAYCKGDCLS